MVTGDVQMDEVRLHSEVEKIVCDDLAYEVLSATSPAMKAENDSLWRFLISNVTANGLDNGVACKMLTMQKSSKIVFQTYKSQQSQK